MIDMETNIYIENNKAPDALKIRTTFIYAHEYLYQIIHLSNVIYYNTKKHQIKRKPTINLERELISALGYKDLSKSNDVDDFLTKESKRLYIKRIKEYIDSITNKIDYHIWFNITYEYCSELIIDQDTINKKYNCPTAYWFNALIPIFNYNHLGQNVSIKFSINKLYRVVSALTDYFNDSEYLGIDAVNQSDFADIINYKMLY